jgi:hypothetical protein
MAFLGDLGNIFLGGASSRDVGGKTGEFLGSFFGPTGKVVGGSIGRDIGKDIGEIGANEVDVSGPPAGVDSPATTAPVSQTGVLGLGGQGFGTNQAFLGGFGLPGLVGTGVSQITRQLTRPGVGGLIGGLGAGAVVDFFLDEFGREKKLVITRKMQRDVKKLFMMSGGDFNMTAELYRMATGRSITGEQVVKIITKTFKNQGPYVTKAAVRKTRSTIRKMETLCDLKDRLCPPKRATPRRRTMGSTTKVLQVK